MYTEGKLLRVERPREAQLTGGLTAAEANQLAMDSYVNPEAFSQLQIICGMQCADREVLRGELTNLQKQKATLERDTTDYQTIWQLLQGIDPNKPEQHRPILSAAHAGAAQAVRAMKTEVQKQSESFCVNAAAYSAEMAALCEERLGGERLLILGRVFDYTDGYLTTNANDTHNYVTVLFGPLSERTDKENILKQREPNRLKRGKITVTVARLQDWEQLMKAIDLISGF